MITDMPTLMRHSHNIRIEGGKTLAARIPYAGINYPVAPPVFGASREKLGGHVIVWIKQCVKTAAANIVKFSINLPDKLMHIGDPSGRFICCHTEFSRVVNGFKQCGLIAVSGIEGAEGSVMESSGIISAHMGERGHYIGSALPVDTTRRWNEIKITDRLREPWVRLAFGRRQKLPIRRISDIFKQVDRRIGRVDEPMIGIWPIYPRRWSPYHGLRIASR